MRISDVFILRANLIAGLSFVPTNLLSLRYVAAMFVAEILSELWNFQMGEGILE